MTIAQYIDHTLLKPTATPSDIIQLCEEAKVYGFYAVCVHSCNVRLAKIKLAESEVKLAAVIGFPLGAMATDSKIAEAKYCVDQGADEIDMVINIGWLKANLDHKVKDEISHIKNTIGNRILKVIIETCYLTDEEKRKACRLAQEAGADFVKTSTGFGTKGATLQDVQLIKDTVSNSMKIKASGGIKDKATAMQYIKLGVTRIGTSSGIKIIS